MRHSRLRLSLESVAFAAALILFVASSATAGFIQTLTVDEERLIPTDNTTAPFDFVFTGLQPIDPAGSFTLDLRYENIDLDNTTVSGEFLSLIIGPGTLDLDLGEFEVTRNPAGSWEASGIGQRVVSIAEIGGIGNFTDPFAIRIQGSPEVEVRDDEGNGFIELTLSYETTAAVPEPSTFALLGMGAAGLMAVRRRRKQAVPSRTT